MPYKKGITGSLVCFVLCLLGFSFECIAAEESTFSPCSSANYEMWNECRGQRIYPNGDEYQGTFKNGKKDGRGLLRKKNGDVFIGNWRGDKPHGAGIEYTGNNKAPREGYWEDGIYIGSSPFASKVQKAVLPNGLTQVQILAKPANCNLNIYVYPETVPLTQKSAAKWNGSCRDGNINGVGELQYIWPDGSTCFFNGDFVSGEPRGFFLGRCTLSSSKAEFRGDAKNFGQFFGVLEIEDQLKNKSVYTGESLYLTPNGRGVMRNISAATLIEGNFKNGSPSGYVVIEYEKTGDRYEGEMLAGKKHGQGVYKNKKESKVVEGSWLNDKFISHSSVDLQRLKLTSGVINYVVDSKVNESSTVVGDDFSTLLKNFNVSHTEPTAYGDFVVGVETRTATTSLKINDEEFGPRSDGSYLIKRLAPAGRESQLRIVVQDTKGNVATKSVSISRSLVDSKTNYAQLNPAGIKRQPEKDAVAIVIGIADYRSLPKADFANDDARVFYDYAIRALGVRPENIKLLVDADADEVAILKAFRNWLPSKVRSSTDVYVYFSGHGYPVEDGNGFYLLPSRADREFISRTSIQLQEINADLQAAKPKSVTIFMDACYSGQARNGENLVASARPIVPKVDKKLFPDNFTVITASQADQWSSSSPELKHGIFSYYLMKGMEGDADTNKDGRITLGEMRAYLVENVGRQAGAMSRKQEPQLIGDAGRVLVGR